MKIRSLRAVFLAGLTLALLSCITVNIYFPEAEVKKAAEDIVNDVRSADKDKEKKDETKKEAVAQSVGFSLLPGLYAQEATEVTTPRIRALKESLKARFPQLVPYFDAGRIGESATGTVQTLNEEGLSLQDKSVFRKLVNDENRDRKDLYTEVTKAMNIDASKIGDVQKIFAAQWIGAAHAGWMIQKADGSWVKK
ncbi:MAG TPA: DUF1318 domain-containing protein [Burkholderiales bacterium]|nr:DUF1318 domain-containing protein [Burkholderiales bacterium]